MITQSLGQNSAPGPCQQAEGSCMGGPWGSQPLPWKLLRTRGQNNIRVESPVPQLQGLEYSMALNTLEGCSEAYIA